VAKIAFIRFLDNPPAGSPEGPKRLWVVGADGTGARDLFPKDPSNDKVDPAWSPDGSTLIVSLLGKGKLYLTDASGSDPVLLDTGCPDCTDSDATFSNDGTRIAFVRTRKESTQGGQAEILHTVIATMDLASGRVVELDSTAETGNNGPRWSPDGTQIVFSRSWLAMPNKFLKAAVFVVDADGQHLRQLSRSTLQARAPDWSPDGSRIVFESLDMRLVGRNVRTSDDIYSVRPDGSGLQRLTTDGLSNGATWMSDGRLLFTHVLGGASGRAAGGFWVMDADGGNVTQLVPAALIADDNYYESGGGRDAAWQPTP
jgi:Periplasmic component of the Tol biopolymer transport system